MSEYTRHMLIHSFDDIRPSFLAAIDQIVAEMRPKVTDIPGFYPESVLACAHAFADPALVRKQLLAIQPDLADKITDGEIVDAHLASIAYLFSLALHELMHTPKELSQ